MSRVAEIGRFDNAFEAHRIASLLLDAGIEAEVDNGHSGGLFSHISGIGIRVVVAEEDRARAEALLAEVLPAPASDLDDERDGDDEDPFDPDGSAAGPDDAPGRSSATVAERVASAADAVPASDGSEGPRDAAADPTAPWPVAKAERWARQLLNLSIGSVLFLGVFPPIGIVMLVYVATKCVDPPLGVNDAPRARRSLRWARVAAVIGGLLLIAIGFAGSWGFALGLT
ncbi:MAG: DUF2007 domain-containing protein [Planctomycetia bacterium]|nr:DUF2007 domain-containing protein [Planctomycetia bacterium]